MDILWNVLEIVANILIIVYILKNWKKQLLRSFESSVIYKAQKNNAYGVKFSDCPECVAQVKFPSVDIISSEGTSFNINLKGVFKMARIVSANHVILNPKEYSGQRVVTFSDIDLVHGRASGTARKRFADNKERFIEGVDYFVRKTDEAKKEFGITAPNGLFLLTETGYLMLVKSFTDDLAWTVQRELVNNYFRIREEKTIQENSNRRKVADIPQNKNFQKYLQTIRKKMSALEVMLDCVNKYLDPNEIDAYMKTIQKIGDQIGTDTIKLSSTQYTLIPEPY